jgi:hypothetical protein
LHVVGDAVTALLTRSAFALELGNPFDTALGREYRAELEVLTVSPKLLPSSCRLVREVKSALIFPATTNPFVTRDPALIRFVSQIGFGSDAISDVTAAMSVLYYDSKPQHEVGVWALRLKDAEAASKVRGLASARSVSSEVRWLLARVWRDDEAGRACQTAIEAHLLKNGFVR